MSNRPSFAAAAPPPVAEKCAAITVLGWGRTGWARGGLAVTLVWLVGAGLCNAPAAEGPENLALKARASAFESQQQDLSPEQAVDGRPETRWSGVPGHNTGGWFELQWDQPVHVAEVVVFQFDRYVKEMDLEVWDEAAGDWRRIEHFGTAEQRLPRVVVSRFAPRETRRLRLANITNGPSFTEVQVFERPFAHPPAVSLASDLNGRLIGMVCDAWGSAPMSGAEITLAAQSRAGPWEGRGRADEHGLFFVPRPLGLRGQIVARVHSPGTDAAVTGAPTHFDLAALPYGLTPANLARDRRILAGPWRFAPDPPPDFHALTFNDHTWPEIKVPAHFVMEGFRSLEGIGGYRTRFRAPSGAGRVKLRFEGVYSGAEVWVNGQRLAYHEGGALPFEVDATDALRAGENLLAVRVTEHTTTSDLLDKMSEYADFPLAGIFRPAYVFRVPSAHLGALAVTTKFDAAFRHAVLQGHAALLNESDGPLENARCEVSLTDQTGTPVAGARQTVALRAGPWGRAEFEFALPVATPRPWEAEHPNLYFLRLQLSQGGRVLERVTQRVGFRQTEVRGPQLFLNGRPVKIRGTCHHDSHPLLGRAVTAALTRQDLELMKEANLNSLRTSHYPPLPELLELADELGVYVEDEGSFCWVEAADDLRHTPRMMQLLAELLARDRNHPSVFMWSVCNESAFGYGFERAREWLRAADPSRPLGGSYDRGSLDLLARHNPITAADVAAVAAQPKPVLWDECWCIFQGIWGDVGELWLDPGIRDYYSAPLPAIYARMWQTPSLAGTQIWAWSDDLFAVPHRGLEYGRGSTPYHFVEGAYRLSGRGLTGDAPWGVVDGWRRPKPEFWITKKLHSPIKITEGPLPLPAAGQPIQVKVENQYDFTDLAELEITWELGRERGRLAAHVPPHSNGQLIVNPGKPRRPGETLTLEFRASGGRLVDAYRLPVGDAPLPLPVFPAADARPLRLQDEVSLAGRCTRVVGGDFELAFDHATGGLRRGVAFGQPMLLELPTLHVLPAGAPLAPLPNRLSWRLRTLSFKPEGSNINVVVEGSYEHFDGRYEVCVTPTGELAVGATFTYDGPRLLARETGLRLSVPRECDSLEWRRRAEWSVYPPDHIGRPAGRVRAFAGHPEAVPPSWAWGADNSPMGCNDFRSTKRQVCWAALGYPKGPAVWLLSDGSQHARAVVETDRIAWHLNDWYGGTGSGLWEWSSNYGEGKALAAGQKLASTVRLRLAPNVNAP